MAVEGIHIGYIRWTDENGCYYEADGTPAGWFIGGHYYDMNGNYVPNDEDPTKLPEHKYNAKPTKLDSWGCFTASDGCYYSQFGEPVGWVLTKPDGNVIAMFINIAILL